MRCVWPVCKRCCFCIPLRYGLLICAYIKLAFPLVAFFIVFSFVPRITAIGYAVFLYCTVDFIVQLLFIVGAHMKNYKIMQIYFYYGFVVVTIGVVGLCIIVAFAIQLIVEINLPVHIVFGYILEIPILLQIISIALNVYLLTLVRSEIVKLRDNHQFKFVNNAAEADCTVTLDHARRDGEDLNSAIDHARCDGENPPAL